MGVKRWIVITALVSVMGVFLVGAPAPPVSAQNIVIDGGL